jgi:hypothetical protein
MGEFVTRVFLFEHLQNQADAVRIAGGWDGDRYMVLQTPRGEGLAWVSVWDAAVDAIEFAQGLESVIAKRYGAVQPRGGASSAKIFTARGRSMSVWGGEISGRPAVIYVDVPEGVPTDIFQADQITAQE